MNGRCKLGAVVVGSVIVLCAGQVALAQVDWTIEGVVVPGPPEGDWHMLGDVVFDGTTFHMYLIGGPGDNSLDNPWSVVHWTSTDLLGPWDPDPCNPVLEPEPGMWDGFTIGSFAVLYDGAMFKMWYGAAPGYHGLGNGGYATNADGWCDWEKHPENPLEGLGPGAPGAWDENRPFPSAVLFDNALYHMWYTGGTGDTWYGSWGIGHATSPDGLVWTRDLNPVLRASEPWEENKVFGAKVVSHGGSLHMWYGGIVLGVSVEMGHADSSDGLVWRKWPGNPVLSGLPGCYAVNSLAVFLEGDTIHGWVSYCGDVRTATSSFEVFSDDFETGTTDLWSVVVP